MNFLARFNVIWSVKNSNKACNVFSKDFLSRNFQFENLFQYFRRKAEYSLEFILIFLNSVFCCFKYLPKSFLFFASQIFICNFLAFKLDLVCRIIAKEPSLVNRFLWEIMITVINLSVWVKPFIMIIEKKLILNPTKIVETPLLFKKYIYHGILQSFVLILQIKMCVCLWFRFRVDPLVCHWLYPQTFLHLQYFQHFPVDFCIGHTRRLHSDSCLDWLQVPWNSTVNL